MRLSRYFLPILREYRDRLPDAVVHCFAGTREEMLERVYATPKSVTDRVAKLLNQE